MQYVDLGEFIVDLPERILVEKLRGTGISFNPRLVNVKGFTLHYLGSELSSGLQVDPAVPNGYFPLMVTTITFPAEDSRRPTLARVKELFHPTRKTLQVALGITSQQLNRARNYFDDAIIVHPEETEDKINLPVGKAEILSPVRERQSYDRSELTQAYWTTIGKPFAYLAQSLAR